MRKCIWLLGLLWCCALAGMAQDFPPRPSPPRLVNDLANILSPEEEQALERKLVAYGDSTSTQIAIVNITSIGPYDVSDYAYQLAEKWGIGQQGKNNGILILTALQERKVFIATGYGMEGVVPDAIAKRITEYTIKPEYKLGNYYAGLDKGTSFIIDVAKGEYKADPKEQQQGESEGGGYMIWVIIGVMILVFIMSRRGGGGRGGRGGGMRTLGGPFLPPLIFGDFSGGRGVFGGGGGGFGGDGGGFGGFGGGSFGGGGAGSDW